MPVPPDPSSSPPPPPPTPPNKRNKDGKARPKAARQAALKRTIVRPARTPVDPIDGAYVSDRMTTLTHELANLLDGSMRCLSMARRGVEEQTVSAVKGGDVARHLETAHAAMHQMAELVKCAMQGLSLAQAPGQPAEAGSLAEAVRHAIDVMSPIADERSVRLSAEVEEGLADSPDRFVFAIVTNAVRNAIESIERAGCADGWVDVQARTEPGRTGRCVVLEVHDNGEGPPELPARGGESVFRLGYSTKPGGSGVGLSFCRELVQELGGTITLSRRVLDAETGRGGACLRAVFPLPKAEEGSPRS